MPSTLNGGGYAPPAPYLFYDKKGVMNPQGGTTYPPPVATAGPQVMAEGTRSLHFALGNMKMADIELLIRDNPDSVHEKGFNGQSPLHKAVLGSDIFIIDLLLQQKPDPNAVNNFQETPFHFACKRGNLQIINLLVQNGADINLVDKAGKGAIHHAAHGGSVYALHYLTEVHNLAIHVRDTNLSTPLHIVCAHGHVEALNYLLRKDRCDLFAQNVHGNNVLHIAANAGHSWTCWRILEEGGLQLLHLQNREGNQPVDLACKNKDPKFRETMSLLLYYTSHRQKTGSARGPVMGWYFHGIMPLLLYPLVLILASWSPRPGAFTAAGLVVLIIILYQHSHRMKHICRWPNPVYFGMFLSGFLHSMICFYYNVAPVLYGDHSFLIQLMVVLNTVNLYLYYVLLTRNPGEAREAAMKPGSLWPYSIQDVADGNARPEAFCVACEVIPPKLTHHCKLCVSCYLNTDHHCLFLYRCVARDNHRLFIVFISLVSTGIIVYLYSLVLYFSKAFPTHAINKEIIGDVFSAMPWEASVFLANSVSVIWGINLVRFQLNVVSKAQTTVYQPNQGMTTLTPKQRFFNIIYFLMGRGHYITDVEFTA